MRFTKIYDKMTLKLRRFDYLTIILADQCFTTQYKMPDREKFLQIKIYEHFLKCLLNLVLNIRPL